ncbi:MAG TPA: hypothetical protein VN799_02435 [Acidimicrobiales bacterium]|nr:hypothetical protein [Acidimicrobiales bacterium]
MQPGTVVVVVGDVVATVVVDCDGPVVVVVVALVVVDALGLGDEQLARAAAVTSAVTTVELRPESRTRGWVKS